MVLCIIPPNFRIIAEVIKDLERNRLSGRTDGHRQTEGRTDVRAHGTTTIPVSVDGEQGKKMHEGQVLVKNLATSLGADLTNINTVNISHVHDEPKRVPLIRGPLYQHELTLFPPWISN